MNRLATLLVLAVVIGLSSAQYTKNKICATTAFTTQCNILQRGTSDVTCIYVQDAIECALLLKNNTAQLGVFSAESTLLLAKLEWEEIVVVKELRHAERLSEPVDFASVVLVKKPYFKGGQENLKNSSFCHPGLHYNRQQKWTERFLKEFERSLNPVYEQCQADMSNEELEIKSMLGFFSTACRPGSWSNNPEEDAKLKRQYPSLCSLCDNPDQCTYSSTVQGSDHRKALECLKQKGEITYVSLQEAQRFIKDNVDTASQFQYYCPNGTVLPALTDNPCVWLQQPWPVILTNRENSVPLNSLIKSWVEGYTEWEQAVKEILTSGNMAVRDSAIQAPNSYISPRRPVPIETNTCKVTWCTSSILENEKCTVARAAGITTGVYPVVECRTPTTDVVRCLNDIKEGNADFMGIDSNYGYIARNNFGLTSAMYAETEEGLYSRVVILVKSTSNIQKFEDLRSRKACFPEFGGIASVAFVDVGRSRGLFSKNECNYGKLLATYFGDTCAPGAKDVLHDATYRQSSPEGDKLCKLCETQTFQPRSEDNFPARRRRQAGTGYCTPTRNNRYFGTQGALLCFDEVGEVAVVEVQKLKTIAEKLKLDTSLYQVMCRDGKVIPINNFDIPLDCPLVTIIDAEVVVKRNSGKQKAIVNALNSFDRYFNLNEEPSFKLYNKYDGQPDLLFEDSTVGLVSANSTKFGPSVQNYIRLFQTVDSCVEKSDSARNTFNTLFILMALMVVYFRLN